MMDSLEKEKANWKIVMAFLIGILFYAILVVQELKNAIAIMGLILISSRNSSRLKKRWN